MPATLAPPPALAAKANPAPIADPSREATQSHEPTPESYLGDIGSELEGLDAAEPVAEPQKRETPPKGPDGKFTKPPEKATQKPQEAPKEETKPEVPPAVEKPVEEEKPSNIRALGKAYDALKKERDTVYQPKIQSLEAKTKQYEQEIEQLKKSAPDVKPLQEKLQAAEQERAKLLETIRFLDFQSHPDYVKNFKEPLETKWQEALSEIDGFQVELENGSVRPVNASDLSNLAAMNLKQRGEQARQWFGDSAPTILGHVKDLIDLSRKQEKAIADAKQAATEYSKTQNATTQQANTAFRQAYDGATAELTKKYPKWFAPDETDAKGNEILKKGFEFADTVFSANGNLTPEQKAGRLAVVRAKAANHDRLAARLKVSAARIAELESDLAKFEKSEPPTDEAGAPSGGAKSGGWYEDIESEIRKIDK